VSERKKDKNTQSKDKDKDKDYRKVSAKKNGKRDKLKVV